MSEAYPRTQRAVQLVGPDELGLNPEKPVFEPGPDQVLCRVEVVGLCFSDLKLLKQFTGHVRKSEIVSGIDLEALDEIPSYVPGGKPTVPGHEIAVTVVRTGAHVHDIKVGDRRLVQADYRWLKTTNSNAAIGYNFEGGLQEYVLMDQRAITSPDGDSMLLPAKEDLPVSAVALVEPWACVEDSYVAKERRGLKAGGRVLVVDGGLDVEGVLDALWTAQPRVGEVIRYGGNAGVVDDESIDDLLFFGGDADLLEQVLPKVAPNGLVVLCMSGKRFGREVNTPVGRLHYGGVRMVGTPGSDPAEALAVIPETGEIRAGDRIDVVGAGGPMGTMHVIRNLCQGVPDIDLFGGDMSTERLAMLDELARPLAEKNGVGFTAYNAQTHPPVGPFDYVALMVPAPALVAAAVRRTAPRGIINIFAGIPIGVHHPVDLDTYAANQLFFIGTSGSTVEDMRIVLSKVTEGTLDTNLSVAAISGLEGAVDGIRAVEAQSMPGKIIVYPSCKGLRLTALTDLEGALPEVAALLVDGHWTQAAEQKLLDAYR